MIARAIRQRRSCPGLREKSDKGAQHGHKRFSNRNRDPRIRFCAQYGRMLINIVTVNDPSFPLALQANWRLYGDLTQGNSAKPEYRWAVIRRPLRGEENCFD